MADGAVLLKREGKVAVVTLDRPAKKNALNETLWRGLDTAVAELEVDLPRAVVLTGAGGAFCAGMDVSPENPLSATMMAGMQNKDREPIAKTLAELRRIVDRLVRLPVPLIAAINGLAYGGGAEIATRLDLRVADPDATLCFSEVRLGLMPDLGGGVALTRLVGPATASDLVLTARRVGSDEALRLGLVNRISRPGNVLAEAVELADAIAKNGPRAVRSALEVIRRTPELSDQDALGLELERATSLVLSAECVHGVTALFSRTDPEFPDVQD